LPAPTRKPIAAPRRGPAAEPADLRQRILDTARALLDEQGTAALSLREVARRAGVTHQAPYHHFADRESILAELVTAGFDELARRLAAANDQPGPARRILVASGIAYVGFALDQPGVFRIMFRPDVCDSARFPHAMAAGDRARGELQRLVRLVHGGADDAALAAMHWAQVHGLAVLLLDGPLGQQFPGRPEQQAFVHQAAELFASQVLGPTRAKA
jgi:AcrR family transcriptional regulator